MKNQNQLTLKNPIQSHFLNLFSNLKAPNSKQKEKNKFNKNKLNNSQNPNPKTKNKEKKKTEILKNHAKIDRQNLKNYLNLKANLGELNFTQKAVLESIVSEININIRSFKPAICTLNYEKIAGRVKKTLAQVKSAVPFLIKEKFIKSKINFKDKRKLEFYLAENFIKTLKDFKDSSELQMQFLNVNFGNEILIDSNLNAENFKNCNFINYNLENPVNNNLKIINSENKNLQTNNIHINNIKNEVLTKKINSLFYKKRNLVKKDSSLTEKQKKVILTSLYYIKKYSGSVSTNLRFLALKSDCSTKTVKTSLEKGAKYLNFTIKNNKTLIKQSQYFTKIDLSKIYGFQTSICQNSICKNSNFIINKNTITKESKTKKENTNFQNYSSKNDNLLSKKKQNYTNLSKQKSTDYLAVSTYDKQLQQFPNSINSYSNKNSLTISNKQNRKSVFNKSVNKTKILNKSESLKENINDKSSKATVCSFFENRKNIKTAKIKNKLIKTESNNLRNYTKQNKPILNLNKYLTNHKLFTSLENKLISKALKYGLSEKLIFNNFFKNLEIKNGLNENSINKTKILKCVKQFNYAINVQKIKINSPNAFFNYIISNCETGLIGFEKAIDYYSDFKVQKRFQDKNTAEIIRKKAEERERIEKEKAIKLQIEKKEDEILKLKNPKEYERKKQKKIEDNQQVFDDLGFDKSLKDIMNRFYDGICGG